MLNSFNAVGRIAKSNSNTTATGTLYVKFTLAVQRDKDKNGNVITDFIPCAIVGKRGEFFTKYCEVGAMLSVNGSMQSGSYEKNGQTVYTFECFVNNYSLLIPAGVKINNNSQAIQPQPIAMPQQPAAQVPQYQPPAPAQMTPPPQIENLPPPDPYNGTLPFSIY